MESFGGPLDKDFERVIKESLLLYSVPKNTVINLCNQVCSEYFYYDVGDHENLIVNTYGVFNTYFLFQLENQHIIKPPKTCDISLTINPKPPHTLASLRLTPDSYFYNYHFLLYGKKSGWILIDINKHTEQLFNLWQKVYTK